MAATAPLKAKAKKTGEDAHLKAFHDVDSFLLVVPNANGFVMAAGGEDGLPNARVHVVHRCRCVSSRPMVLTSRQRLEVCGAILLS